jgi:hypothetical protein
MTLIIALGALLSFPVIYGLLRAFPHRRSLAFVAIGALPFLTNLPVSGYIYGWPVWAGVVKGIEFPLLDSIALALIATRRRTATSVPFWGLIALYGLTLLLSIFQSRIWLATAFSCWQFLLVVLVFGAVAGEAHLPKLRYSLWIGMALGLTYQAGYVVFQKLTGVVQAAGTMAHQNILGLTIELTALPLIAALLAGSRSKLVGMGVVAALVCTAGTGSRATSGIITGAVIVMLLISMMRRPTRRKSAIAVLAVIALVVMTPFALGTLNERFRGASFVTDEGERQSFEKAARRMASDYPLGVGANQFVLVDNLGGYAEAAGVTWRAIDRSVPVHNAYLLARAETGWLGEFAFILLLVVPAIRATHFALGKQRSANGDLALGSAIALAANMIHNNYEFAVHTFSVEVLVMINLGMIAALLREDRLARPQIARERSTEAAQECEGEPEAERSSLSAGVSSQI